MSRTQTRDYSTVSNRNSRFQLCLCAKPWFSHGKRPRERNTVFAKHSGCRQFPRCQLHGRVTADVRVRAARGISCFRVGDDTGVERLRSTPLRYSRSIPASAMRPQTSSPRLQGSQGPISSSRDVIYRGGASQLRNRRRRKTTKLTGFGSLALKLSSARSGLSVSSISSRHHLYSGARITPKARCSLGYRA
jgi:hypothetical protein